MSVSVSSYIFYGVKVDRSDLLEEVTTEEQVNCHPDANDEDDTFCSVCGEKLVQETTELALKEKFKGYLPDVPDWMSEYRLNQINPSNIGEEWLDMESWPEGSPKLDFDYEGGYSDATYGFLGNMIMGTGDLMYGENCKPKSFQTDTAANAEAREALLEMGFAEEDIKLYHFASVG